MPKIVEFEGQRYEFPDDATDAEIASALGGAQNAPTPSAAPNADLSILQDPKAQWEPTVVPEQPADWSPTAKSLVKGTQGALSGLNSAAFLLPDLAAGAANIPLAATDMVRGWAGADPIGFRFQRPGDIVAQKAYEIARSFGVPVVDPDTLPFRERLPYNIAKFGTEAAVAGTTLAAKGIQRGAEVAASQAKPRLFDPLIRLYTENPGKVVAGDALAGAGAGTGITATQSLPDHIRALNVPGTSINVGAIADLVGALTGGIAGGTTANVALNGPQGVINRAKQNLPAKEVPLGPDGNPVTNLVADRAARFVQDEAIDAEAAANAILKNVDLARANNMPVPTPGLISEDVGVTNIERMARVKNPTPFQANDQKLYDFAGETIQSTAPQNAAPRSFTDTIESLAAARRADAEGKVQHAESYVNRVDQLRRAQSDALAEYALPRTKTANAETVDRTFVEDGLRPMQQEKNRRYNAIDPDNTEIRPVDDLVATATRIQDEAARMPAALRTEIAPDDLLTQIRGLAAENDGPGTMSFADMNTMRRSLSTAAQRARAGSQFGLAESYDALRASITRETDRLATEQSPAGMRAAEANRFYQEDFAPFRGTGPGDEVARFRKDFNKDPVNRSTTPPSQTVERFMQPNQPEKAASFRRAIDATPTNARGVQAASDWVMGELAESKAIRGNGTLSPEGINTFTRKWGATFDAWPEVRQRIDEIAARARKGEISAKRFAQEVQDATRNLRDTEAQLKRGAFRAVLGKDPENAVAGVFGSGDAERTMTELKATLRGNKDAEDGLKRAIADYLYRKVSDVKPETVTEGTTAPNFARLTKFLRDNERVLAAAGFTPDEMNALRRAQKTLEPLAQRQGKATVGSPTAENQELGWRVLEVGLKSYYGGLKGGNITRNVRLMRNIITPNRSDEAMDLVIRAMTDPELAAHLLTRKVAEAGSPAWNAKLAKLLRRAEFLDATLPDAEKPED